MSDVVRTVGVDLAKAATTTAVCSVLWRADGAFVESVVVGAENEAVLGAASAEGVAVVAIDAPFGWPRAMVAAVSAWRPGGRWAAPGDRAFRLRRTDDVTGLWTKQAIADLPKAERKDLLPALPMSVSADRIAMVAWRCCGLLDKLAQRGAAVVTAGLGHEFQNDGELRAIEAYPAAALALWGIPRGGYKDEGAVKVREEIIARVEKDVGPGRIEWATGVREQCVETDHALDAFLCALVARAAMRGLVEAVPDSDADAAKAEGWIALPTRDSLRTLVR